MVTQRGNAKFWPRRRELIAMLIGVALYAGLSLVTNYAEMDTAGLADIRPSVAIPIFFGFIYGPVVGFVVGFGGNLLFDVLVGNTMFPPDPMTGNALRDVVAGFVLNWQVGNGIAGFVAGLLALFHRRYRTFTDMGLVILFIFLAEAAGTAFAAITDLWVYGGLPGYEFVTLQWTMEAQFVPIFRHNLISALLLVPFLLINWEYLDLKAFNIRSHLLRRLALFMSIAAYVPILLLIIFLPQGDAGTGGGFSAAQLLFTLLLTLVFTVANAIFASQSITVPLLHLSTAAKDMESGNLTPERAAELKATVGEDEISQLSRVFGNMAEQVIQREAALKRQLESLRIEVDTVKQSKQVSEITDTDFFRDLQVKARNLRGRAGEGVDLIEPAADPAPSSQEA
ncbi:MAG: ECF transporter S component [Anaerolineae bacterium]